MYIASEYWVLTRRPPLSLSLSVTRFSGATSLGEEDVDGRFVRLLRLFFFFGLILIRALYRFRGFSLKLGQNSVEPGRASRARVPTLAQVGGLRRNVRIPRSSALHLYLCQAHVVHELSVTSVHSQKKRRSWHPSEATVRNIRAFAIAIVFS